jgi:hypothetical protein
LIFFQTLAQLSSTPTSLSPLATAALLEHVAAHEIADDKPENETTRGLGHEDPASVTAVYERREGRDRDRRRRRRGGYVVFARSFYFLAELIFAFSQAICKSDGL